MVSPCESLIEGWDPQKLKQLVKGRVSGLKQFRRNDTRNQYRYTRQITFDNSGVRMTIDAKFYVLLPPFKLEIDSRIQNSKKFENLKIQKTFVNSIGSKLRARINSKFFTDPLWFSVPLICGGSSRV